MAAPQPDPLADLASLSSFTPTRLLSNDRDTKTAAVLGTLADQPAIVRLAREPFGDDALMRGEATRGVVLTPVVRNDVYLRATGVETKGTDNTATPSLAVEVIAPATDKHIAKYSDQARVSLIESWAAYQAVTLPAILATPASRTAWVDNILDGTAEADRVLARWPRLAGGGGEGASPAQAALEAVLKKADPSTTVVAPPTTPFVLLPDLKWDGADRARLYAVAIFGDPALRSLRDLDTAERVAAVRRAHKACLAALTVATGIRPPALRCYFHFHPSYWRLHIHYAAHGVPASDGVGKAHAVEDVLGDEDGEGGSAWARKSMVVSLGESDPLAAPLSAWMDKM